MKKNASKMIPYGRQYITNDDADAVLETLKSDFLTQGPKVPEFELALSQYCGSRHCVAVNSATSALHIGCLALGLGPGDFLWTSPNSFVASSNCGLYCGATVDFIDIDERTYNISIFELEKKLESAKKENKLPKIIIPVHFAGASCEMERLKELSEQYGFSIIEDASHGVGGDCEQKKIGSCHYSDITVFSFHPVKIITTGEGGAALTNDEDLYKKMMMFRSHGITKESSDYIGDFNGPWKYEQHFLGFNYRMTDLQASLGLSQLKKLDEFVHKRREIVKRYFELLKDIDAITLPCEKQQKTSSWHLFVICLKDKKKREPLFNFLRENGVGVNVHYIPIHLQPYYRKLGFERGSFPIAENYYETAITLPLYPFLSENDLQYIKDKLIQGLKSLV